MHARRRHAAALLSQQTLQAFMCSWVEVWSAVHGKSYFFAQEFKAATWDRPADLAWQRVAVVVDAVDAHA